MNKKGAAILVPGQYLNVYCVGKHQGRYDALVQTGGKVKVWRRQSDGEYSNNKEEFNGFYGINIHRASENAESTVVGRWSAGCQVMANPEDFATVLKVMTAALKPPPAPCATYTLLSCDDNDSSNNDNDCMKFSEEEPFSNMPDPVPGAGVLKPLDKSDLDEDEKKFLTTASFLKPPLERNEENKDPSNQDLRKWDKTPFMLIPVSNG